MRGNRASIGRRAGMTLLALVAGVAAVTSAAGPVSADEITCDWKESEFTQPNEPRYDVRSVYLVMCDDFVYTSVDNNDLNDTVAERWDKVYVDRAESGPNPTEWEGWLGTSADKREGQSESVERDPSIWHDGYWFRGCAHNDNSTRYFCTPWYQG